MSSDSTRDAVRKHYANVVKQSSSCCCSCSCGSQELPADTSHGYTEEELASLPDGTVSGLGCGSPVGAAGLSPGEVVLDLGAGSGIDVFLAAGKVGPTGRVVGLDMTDEMVQKARSLAAQHGYPNVEFRLGDMENIPLEDGSVDVVLSNCAINLCPDKLKVFREAHRVLRPGGRLVLSDIVTDRPVPQAARTDLEAWSECLAGALAQHDYTGAIQNAGFTAVEPVSLVEWPASLDNPAQGVTFFSLTLKAHK